MVFVGECVKGVAAGKIKQVKYGEWVEGAKDNTRRRYEERRKGGGKEEVAP